MDDDEQQHQEEEDSEVSSDGEEVSDDDDDDGDDDRAHDDVDDGQVCHEHDMLQKGLGDLLSSGHLCDVTLIAREQRFQAHRVVLAAVSPYFLSMFTSDMLEAQQTEIRLHGIEPATLKQLVEFAYTSKVRVTSCNVQNLLAGAHLLQINCIVDACSDYMKSRLEISNVVNVFQIAITFSCRTLEDAAEKFIVRNFRAAAQTEEFLCLHQPVVARILAHNGLSVTSEEDVFKAAIAWVKTDVENRKESMATLLSLVRLPLLKFAYLTKTVASEELIRNSVGCQELLNKAIDYHKNPGNRPFLRQTFIVRPRCCYDEPGSIIAVGGTAQWSGGPPDALVPQGLNSVEVYDTIVGQWASLQVPDEGISFYPRRPTFGVAVLDGLLYAIGGWSNPEEASNASQVVEVFSPNLNQWNQTPQLHSRRSACGAVVCAGKVYVCGGYVAQGPPLASVEYYNPDTGTWVLLTSLLSQMITPRGAAGVAALNGKIYVMGGHGGANIDVLTFLDSMDCFDTELERWTRRAPMSTRRYGLGAAALKGKIYACGGYSGQEDLASVECYNPSTNEWTRVASMNTRRCGLSVVANCGKLYAIGGSDGSTMLSSMEIYSPDENLWRFGPNMKSHKGQVGVGLVPMEN